MQACCRGAGQRYSVPDPAAVPLQAFSGERGDTVACTMFGSECRLWETLRGSGLQRRLQLPLLLSLPLPVRSAPAVCQDSLSLALLVASLDCCRSPAMGNALSGEGLEGGRNVGRQQAVTEGKARRRGLPPNSVRSTAEDWPFIEVGAARMRASCSIL